RTPPEARPRRRAALGFHARCSGSARRRGRPAERRRPRSTPAPPLDSPPSAVTASAAGSLVGPHRPRVAWTRGRNDPHRTARPRGHDTRVPRGVAGRRPEPGVPGGAAGSRPEPRGDAPRGGGPRRVAGPARLAAATPGAASRGPDAPAVAAAGGGGAGGGAPGP